MISYDAILASFNPKAGITRVALASLVSHFWHFDIFGILASWDLKVDIIRDQRCLGLGIFALSWCLLLDLIMPKCPKRCQNQKTIESPEYLVRNPVQAALQSNKRLKAKHLKKKTFGLAWPWDRRGPGTYPRFVQSPLMIDLWMEECPILMIFSYFLWKWRWSPSQD